MSWKAAGNGANWVFVPHPILYNVKTESVSGNFRLSAMTRTLLIEWFKDCSIDHKRVWVASSSRFFFYSAPDLVLRKKKVVNGKNHGAEENDRKIYFSYWNIGAVTEDLTFINSTIFIWRKYIIIIFNLEQFAIVFGLRQGFLIR